MYIISQMPLCRLLLVTFIGSCLAACATRVASPNWSEISSSIEARTGRGLRLEHDSRDIFEEISLDDGVTEDEAVAIALWNNAAFQADLATLGFARADLIEAGLLRNPILSVFFPLGPKQLESTATWPIEAIWQRPRRVAAATFDAQKVAENLVKHGLDLARDVRGAHAEVLLTQERLRLAEEAMRLRQSIARITDARLRAGDISMLETNVAVSRSRMAEEQAQRFRHEARAAIDHIRFLLGMKPEERAFDVTPSSTELREPDEFKELLADAFASRPDLRAAELALQAAGERAGLEEAKILNLSAMLDINGEGTEGFEAGPGLLVELPIFNTNQAGRARAQTELDYAAQQYIAVQQRIASEVQRARTRFRQAVDALRFWRHNILPPLEETVRQAALAHASGEVSGLFVIEATLQRVEASLQSAVVEADLRRARSELNRSIGRKRF